MIFIPYTWAGYAIYQGMNFMIRLRSLKFSRDAEREADYLGLQYMYKAGYDPNSFVAFFEKVQSDEKKQPGTIPKVFSTHPPTPDRIEATQGNRRILPAREEYIVSTSEFDTVKQHLERIKSNQKVKNANPNKPTLRRRYRPEQGRLNHGWRAGSQWRPAPGTSSSPQSSGSDDDRPTLKAPEGANGKQELVG